MEFAILGSGSRGNASLVRKDGTLLLIDCGFSWPETRRRLDRLGVAAADVAALLVTHEHADHVGGAARFSSQTGCPLWTTAGTAQAAGLEGLEGLRLFSPHSEFTIGALAVNPFPVPHDAREPVQFTIRSDDHRLGILSDAGAVTPHMRHMLSDCDGLLLEFNHCPRMLESGPYPPALRLRVGGGRGHLSNQQSAELLGSIAHQRLQFLALTHISEKNNLPGLALAAAREALDGFPAQTILAEQQSPMAWRTLE